MKRVTIPGEGLGVIEEYSPGYGTYVDGGVIRSALVGYVNLENRVTSVESEKLASKVVLGSVVVGCVQSSGDRMLAVRILKADGRELPFPCTGILHVGRPQGSSRDGPRGRRGDRDRGRDRGGRDRDGRMSGGFKAGDMVIAKVISDKNALYHLTAQDDNLGVVLAFCTKCGNELKLTQEELFCDNCGKKEKRKIAVSYGSV